MTLLKDDEHRAKQIAPILLRGAAFFAVGWGAATPFARERLYHDVTSYLAPVVLSQNGLAKPYVDFFDIKPPGLLLLLDLWVRIFGFSVLSITFLDALMIASLLFVFYLLLSCLNNPMLRLLGVVALSLSFLAGRFHSVQFQTETIGLIMVLTAALLILRHRRHLGALFAAGFLITFSSQVKDVFVPVFVTTAVFLLIDSVPGRSTTKSRLLSFLGGGVLAALVTLTYLAVHGSTTAYFHVLLEKFNKFPLTMSMVIASGAMLIVMIALLPWLRSRSAVWDASGLRPVLLATSLFLGCALGIYWQGKVPVGHYGQPLFVFWLFLLIAVGDLLLIRRVRILTQTRVTLLLLVLAVSPVVLEYALRGGSTPPITSRDILRPFSLETPNSFLPYQELVSHTERHDCVTQTYGWDAGATYLYTQRRSCSRYFLPNIMDIRQGQEYRGELLDNPPAAVLYVPKGADLRIDEFEASVFPWKRVLDDCYVLTQSGNNVYVPKPNVYPEICVADSVSAHLPIDLSGA